jgi:hypothetical protein
MSPSEVITEVYRMPEDASFCALVFKNKTDSMHSLYYIYT